MNYIITDELIPERNYEHDDLLKYKVQSFDNSIMQPFKQIYIVNNCFHFGYYVHAVNYENFVSFALINRKMAALKWFNDENYVMDKMTLTLFYDFNVESHNVECFLNYPFVKYLNKSKYFFKYVIVLKTLKKHNFKIYHRKKIVVYHSLILRKLKNICLNKSHIKRRNKDIKKLKSSYNFGTIDWFWLNPYKLKKRYFRGYKKN